MDLVAGDVGRGRILGVFHLVAKDEEVIFDVGEASWRGFPLGGVANCWHFDVISLKLNQKYWRSEFVRSRSTVAACVTVKKRLLWRGGFKAIQKYQPSASTPK